MAAVQSSIATCGWLVATIWGSTDTAASITREVLLDGAAPEFRPLGWGFPELVTWALGHVGCSQKGSQQRHFSLLGTGSTVKGLPVSTA